MRYTQFRILRYIGIIIIHYIAKNRLSTAAKNIDDTALYFEFFKIFCKKVLTCRYTCDILALQSKTGTCKGALSPALSLFFSPAWVWLHVLQTWAATRKTPGAALQAVLHLDIVPRSGETKSGTKYTALRGRRGAGQNPQRVKQNRTKRRGAAYQPKRIAM